MPENAMDAITLVKNDTVDMRDRRGRIAWHGKLLAAA
jgi:hypothetical protein